MISGIKQSYGRMFGMEIKPWQVHSPCFTISPSIRILKLLEWYSLVVPAFSLEYSCRDIWQLNGVSYLISFRVFILGMEMAGCHGEYGGNYLLLNSYIISCKPDLLSKFLTVMVSKPSSKMKISRGWSFGVERWQKYYEKDGLGWSCMMYVLYHGWEHRSPFL